jgi:hypothetical protein
MVPTRLAVAAVLLLAAVLRFGALGWGLRHTPHLDEQFFVENVRGMLVRGDLDHRFHEYPGLLFYMLLPVVGAADRTTLAREGYLLARGFVAAFGVVSVGLAYVLGRTMWSRPAGLLAALLVAVSPIEVQTAHMVRPDVVLEAFVLAAFLAFARVGPARAGDLLSGAAIGAATAVKFSGVLIAPSYVLRRLATPGPRLPRLALAGAVSLAVFAVLSPYTLLHFQDFLAGARSQVSHHYVIRPRGEQPYLGMLYTYGVRVLAKGLGVLGLALAGAGAVIGIRQDWRRWVPLVSFPLVAVAVFSTAEVNRDRYVLSTLGLLSVCAGVAVARFGERWPAPAAAVGLLAAVGPLAESGRYLAVIAHPGTRDLALDWIAANVPARARLLTTLPELGLDHGRYEVLTADGYDQRAAFLAPSVDLVVATQEQPGLQTVWQAPPADRSAGPPVVLARPASPRRLRAFAVAPSDLSASENQAAVGAMLDGDLDTRWSTDGSQAPGTWIEVRLPAPRPVGAVELALGDRPRQHAANLHLFTAGPDGVFRRARVAEGRPPLNEQLGEPSQLLLFPATPVASLRLLQVGRRVRPWSVAELRLFEQVGP